MFDRQRYPNNKAGATMAVYEFLAAQGMRLGPITLETQSEDYFIESRRRAYEVKKIYVVSEDIEGIKRRLMNSKKSPLRTTSKGKLVWNDWLEFKFEKAGEGTRGTRGGVVAEYKSKNACKPPEPDTVTFVICGKVTGIHQNYLAGMLVVILCVACGLWCYLILASPPPKSDWQNSLDVLQGIIRLVIRSWFGQSAKA